jgi:transposase InsO family protein
MPISRKPRESSIAASMGSIGDCYDNAMAESFFATLETGAPVVRGRAGASGGAGWRGATCVERYL